jgi:hypothetical protein
MKKSGNSKKYEKANSLVETDQSAARKVIRLVAEDRAENRGDDNKQCTPQSSWQRSGLTTE